MGANASAPDRRVLDDAALAALVLRFLQALERFDVEAAAECFTDDLYYLHPPFSPDDNDGQPHEVRGRAALIELCRHRRGPRPGVTHEVTWSVLQGRSGLIQGRFTHPDGSDAGTWISPVRVSDDGRIASYAVFTVGQVVRSLLAP